MPGSRRCEDLVGTDCWYWTGGLGVVGFYTVQEGLFLKDLLGFVWYGGVRRDLFIFAVYSVHWAFRGVVFCLFVLAYLRAHLLFQASVFFLGRGRGFYLRPYKVLSSFLCLLFFFSFLFVFMGGFFTTEGLRASLTLHYITLLHYLLMLSCVARLAALHSYYLTTLPYYTYCILLYYTTLLHCYTAIILFRLFTFVHFPSSYIDVILLQALPPSCLYCT